MINTFINPSIGKATELGISRYEENPPTELRSNDSVAEIETVTHAV